MKRRWLISRTDRLGDLLLTLPMGNFIRVHLPEVEPTFLVSSYAAPLVELHNPPFPLITWAEKTRLSGYEALIHVYPRREIAWRGLQDRIPRRVGTSRRWYHWLTCTDLPSVKRQYSGKHEALLNLMLLTPLLPSELRELIWSLSWEELLSYRARLLPSASLPFLIQNEIDAHNLRIVLHMGSGGGAPTWPHWVELAHLLVESFPEALLILTGTEAEKPRIETIIACCPKAQWLNTAGLLSLSELITLISTSHLVIAGSTGPLHIAAALDVPSIGLYPATAAMGPWRWRPLSPYAISLSTNEVCSKCPLDTCVCLDSIPPRKVLSAAIQLLQSPRILHNS
ncbi:MAG: glycosyltransferase family 9 protein [Bacteroidia bacterium]|nr:glycosyltransferase family 9 protein [Bacteroidia bacterium]MDW8056830.1 glycosyltransferase family 9 protein [Bacteroidia bacterium]